MSNFGAFLSGVSGVSVLVGYFMTELNNTYHLILIGGILALVSAFVIMKSNKAY